MNIDFIGGSYEQKYKEFNSQRTINWYVVPGTQQEQNKSQKALFPTPGLKLFLTLPGTFLRGIFTAATPTYNRCFAVSDNVLYELFVNGTYTALGTMSNMAIGASKVYLVVNANNQVGIFTYSASYCFDMTTNILSQITHPQFPGNAKTAAYTDGYTFISSNGITWYGAFNDITTWIGTQFYTPTFTAANVVAMGVFNHYVYSFTSQTIDPYLNDGATPYSAVQRSTITIGLGARDSLATFDAGFLFLGRSIEGQYSVYFYDGAASCTPISPFSVNWALNRISGLLSDAYGFIMYTRDGHINYYLTVPGLDTTFVYDIVTKEWTERQSVDPNNYSDGSQNSGPFRGKYYVNFKGLNLFTDAYSTSILSEDYDTFTENGTVIIRTRITKTYSEEGKYIDVGSCEFDCNTGLGTPTGQGSNPMLMISWSGDGGYMYSEPVNQALGAEGQFNYRAKLDKLGTERSWTIKFVLTDPVDLMIQNAYAHGSVST